MQKVLLVALLVASASARLAMPATPQDTEKAKEGMLKLMNLGAAFFESARKTVDNHAYSLGENMGKHIAEDQENEHHSVETKLEAAREGMKDSVGEAEDILQQSVHEVRGIIEDQGIHEAVEAVAKPIRANPQFGYFANFLEENILKGNDFADQTLSAMETNMQDEHAKKFLGNLHKSFNEGAAAEMELQMKKLQESPDGEVKGGLSVKDHGDILQAKMNTLIKSAGSLARVGLDTAPGVLNEATKAAKEVQNKQQEQI